MAGASGYLRNPRNLTGASDASWPSIRMASAIARALSAASRRRASPLRLCLPRGTGPWAFTTAATTRARSIRSSALFCEELGSDQPQTDRLGSFLAVRHVNGDALPVRQAGDPGTLQRRGVHEDVLAAL